MLLMLYYSGTVYCLCRDLLNIGLNTDTGVELEVAKTRLGCPLAGILSLSTPDGFVAIQVG